ncbi:hypothetical protein ABZ904_37210 [Streptomyces sp. NPDC046900]|uniref:hypothetical protein n=1 Tax=Streptomyces sp. NPDC046900 TaxID=3155473 RepID=UPI0033D01D75
MTHWVYAFAGCPDTGDFQESAGEEEPGEVVFRDRAGGFGVIDGFVRESVDGPMLVARYRWVASGDALAVAPAVLRAASELPPWASEAGGQ